MTEKYLRVTMDDGSQWDIPAEIIAESRAKYYAQYNTGQTCGMEYDKVFNEEFANTLSDDYEIEDWAANNMNWSDVEDVAVKVFTKEVDFQEGWLNGEKKIIEK